MFGYIEWHVCFIKTILFLCIILMVLSKLIICTKGKKCCLANTTALAIIWNVVLFVVKHFMYI